MNYMRDKEHTTDNGKQDFEFAALNSDELMQVKDLEKKLGVTLIAYDKEE